MRWEHAEPVFSRVLYTHSASPCKPGQPLVFCRACAASAYTLVEAQMPSCALRLAAAKSCQSASRAQLASCPVGMCPQLLEYTVSTQTSPALWSECYYVPDSGVGRRNRRAPQRCHHDDVTPEHTPHAQASMVGMLWLASMEARPPLHQARQLLQGSDPLWRACTCPLPACLVAGGPPAGASPSRCLELVG